MPVKEQTGGFRSMLLSALVAKLLGNFLGGKGDAQVGEGMIRAGWDFWYCLTFWLILKYKNIKMNLNFVVFQEIIYLKYR